MPNDDRQSNMTCGPSNIEIKSLKMCQICLAHVFKAKDAHKRLIESKSPNKMKLMAFGIQLRFILYVHLTLGYTKLLSLGINIIY